MGLGIQVEKRKHSGLKNSKQRILTIRKWPLIHTVGRKKFLKKIFDQSQKFQDIHNFLH